MNIFRALVVGVLLPLPVAIFASSDLEEEIVTTATRTPLSTYKSLSATTVLTKEDIARMQVRDFPELLRTQPGFEFDDNGGRGSSSSIRIRGSESDHVLVLIDGVRTASATSGTTNIQHIPINQIERVEIVRGPRSSLYGADALAGIIQIFTKRGSDSEHAFAPSITAEYGSHDRRAVSVGALGNINGTYYRFNVGNEETNGIDRTVGLVGDDEDRDGYRETNYSASIGSQITDAFRIEGGYIGNEGSTQFDSGNAGDKTDFTNENAYLQIEASLDDDLLAKINLGYNRDDRETFSNNPGIFETTRKSANIQLDYQVAQDSQLIIGLDHYVDDVDSTAGFTEDQRENDAFYLLYIGDYGLIDLQAGFRHDSNEEFGENTTGNFAIGFDLTDSLLLSLSYGSAFKAPTFNDLYFPFTDFGFGFTFEGNPNLEAETSETLELLLKAHSDRVDAYISIYQTDVEDLITSTATSVENIQEADIVGAELGAEFLIAGFKANIGLSYVESENANTNERLPRRAREKATLDLARTWGDFDVNLSWLAQGNRLDSTGVLAGYNLVDIKVTYHASEQLKVGANVKNVFDTDYTLVSSFREFRTEGQTASLFVNYDFY